MSNIQNEKWLDYDKKLHKEAGLEFCEVNEDGDPIYIGTDVQWKAFEKLTYK